MITVPANIKTFWAVFNGNPKKIGTRIAEELAKRAAEGDATAINVLEKVTQ